MKITDEMAEEGYQIFYNYIGTATSSFRAALNNFAEKYMPPETPLADLGDMELVRRVVDAATNYFGPIAKASTFAGYDVELKNASEMLIESRKPKTRKVMVPEVYAYAHKDNVIVSYYAMPPVGDDYTLIEHIPAHEVEIPA